MISTKSPLAATFALLTLAALVCLPSCKERPPTFQEIVASGYEALAAGEPGEAEKRFESALIAPMGEKGSLRPRVVARGLTATARAYELEQEHEPAKRTLNRALEIAEEAIGTDPAQTAQTLDVLADVYESEGDFAKALDVREREAAAFTRAYGQHHPAVTRTMERIVALYRGRGEPQKAELMLRKILDLRESSLGGEHPLVLKTLIDLAAVLRDVDNPEEATRVSARVQRTLGRKATERAKAEAERFDR